MMHYHFASKKLLLQAGFGHCHNVIMLV